MFFIYQDYLGHIERCYVGYLAAVGYKLVYLTYYLAAVDYLAYGLAVIGNWLAATDCTYLDWMIQSLSEGLEIFRFFPVEGMRAR